MSWRNCRASVQLANELDAFWPNRDRASDGTVGNTAHITAGWTSSDHNPWVVVEGIGVVRARDIDEDGIDGPWLAEWLRLRGKAGDPRLAGGGYVIYEGRITLPDFSGWKPYTGVNAHKIHIHVSFSRNRAGFDSTARWGIAEEYEMQLGELVNFRPNRGQNVWDALEQIQKNQGAILAALAPIERVLPGDTRVTLVSLRQEIANIRTAQLSAD